MKSSTVRTAMTVISFLSLISCHDSSSRYMESVIDGPDPDMTYGIGVYLPDGYSRKNVYPVVYFGNGKLFSDCNYSHLLDSLIEHSVITPIIAVCMDAAVLDDCSAGTDFLSDYLIPFAESEYSVSSERKDRIFFGIGNSADAGLATSLNRPDLIGEYWCLSPSHIDVSSFPAVDQQVLYRILWSTRDELNLSFDFYPMLVSALKKRGGSVKSRTLDAVPGNELWQEAFLRLVCARFGVEQ